MAKEKTSKYTKQFKVHWGERKPGKRKILSEHFSRFELITEHNGNKMLTESDIREMKDEIVNQIHSNSFYYHDKTKEQFKAWLSILSVEVCNELL